MLIAPQVFEVTELLDFYYGATWSTSRKNLFNWKEDPSAALRSAQGDWSHEAAVKSFFDQRRFLKVLRDYIIFLTKDDELTKVILRQHQTRAVEKVIERVYDADQAPGPDLAHPGQRQDADHDHRRGQAAARRARR